MRKRRGIVKIIFVTVLLVTLFALSAISSFAMQLFVTTLSGRHITVEFEPTDKIEDVRAKILEKEGLLQDEYDLFYNNELLVDGNTLQDYAIVKDFTLDIVLHDYVDCECVNCEKTVAHVFSGCDDTDCDNEGCTVTREAVAHAFTDCYDLECDNEGCTYTREYATHVFDDCTDKYCNIDGCPHARRGEKNHAYTDCTDNSCNNEGCNTLREAKSDHAFAGCTDATCNNDGCTFTRADVKEHIGEPTVCDSGAICEVCGYEFGEPLPHESSGIYVANETHHFMLCKHWNEFSSCTEVYEYAPHEFGQWVIIKESDYFVQGVRERYCVCGKTETENTPIRSILDEDIGRREILVVGAIAVGILMLWGVAAFINRH